MATTVESTTTAAPQRRSGEETAVLASRVALGVLTATFAVLLAADAVPPLEVQMLLYLVGMVALNLPHGGFEHFTNVRRRGLPFGGRYLALYLGFVAAFTGLFFVAPVLGLGLAFATAMAKSGHGDLRVMDALTGTSHLRTRSQRALAALVRGAPVMVVPMVAWPETFQQFGAVMVRIFDPAAVSRLDLGMALGPPVLGSLLAVAVVVHVLLGYRAEGASTAWRRDVGELALLLAFFAVVPVVVAIGLYFPLWYSLRQSARSAVAERALGEPAESEGMTLPLAFGVLIVGALATALVAALLWAVAPDPLGGASLLPGVVAFYTIFVSIIAMPHVVVGEWLDPTRGIWFVP